MADFLRVPGPGNETHVTITHLTDGRVMCCLCFGYFTKQQLHKDPEGQMWDYCKECALVENR